MNPPGVAGVGAPAFVERRACRTTGGLRRWVSPGWEPRPSLSAVGRSRLAEAGGGVAGVGAPAFVERGTRRRGGAAIPRAFSHAGARRRSRQRGLRGSQDGKNRPRELPTGGERVEAGHRSNPPPRSGDGGPRVDGVLPPPSPVHRLGGRLSLDLLGPAAGTRRARGRGGGPGRLSIGSDPPQGAVRGKEISHLGGLSSDLLRQPETPFPAGPERFRESYAPQDRPGSTIEDPRGVEVGWISALVAGWRPPP